MIIWNVLKEKLLNGFTSQNKFRKSKTSIEAFSKVRLKPYVKQDKGTIQYFRASQSMVLMT